MGVTSLLLGARATLTNPVLAGGEVTDLTVNSDGRLRVSTKPGFFPAASGELTTTAATPTNLVEAVGGAGFLAIDVTDASNVVFHLKNAGSATMSAGAFQFEGSIDSTNGVDGTWFGIQAVRLNANTIETALSNPGIAAGAATAQAYEASVNAVRWFRIRVSTNVTTNSIAKWTLTRGSYATEPIPAAQSHSVSISGFPGGTSFKLTTTAGTNAQNLRGSAANLYTFSVFNSSAATIYVKFYDKATTPAPATDVPAEVYPVAAGATLVQSFGAIGMRFGTGLGIAVTGGAANNDATAVSANILIHVTS